MSFAVGKCDGIRKTGSGDGADVWTRRLSLRLRGLFDAT